MKPVSETSLIPAVEIALQQAENTKHFKMQLDEMNEALNNRKIVEKAKGMLMKHLNISEDEAFSKMRKISMNKQVPLDKVARRVLIKYKS